MALPNPQPKPIFVVRMPRKASTDSCTVMSEEIKRNMPDYHVLVLKDMWTSGDNVKFEVFNTDSFQQIEFDKLQKRLLTLATDTMKYEKL